MGKALGLAEELLERIAKSIYWWGADLKEQLGDCDIDYQDPQVAMLVSLAEKLIGFPRHLADGCNC